MRNYLGDGNLVTLTTAAAIATGAGLLSGGFFGITCAPAGAGQAVECLRQGEFTVTKNSAEAWAVGDTIYWNDTTKVFTIASSGNTQVGFATEIAANPSSSGVLLLVPKPGGVVSAVTNPVTGGIGLSVGGVQVGGTASPYAFTSRALTEADNGQTLICASSKTATVNTGLPSGFGCAFKGAISFDGTATVTDVRTTGATNPWCGLVNTGTNTYDVVGTKA